MLRRWKRRKWLFTFELLALDGYSMCMDTPNNSARRLAVGLREAAAAIGVDLAAAGRDDDDVLKRDADLWWIIEEFDSIADDPDDPNDLGFGYALAALYDWGDSHRVIIKGTE